MQQPLDSYWKVLSANTVRDSVLTIPHVEAEEEAAPIIPEPVVLPVAEQQEPEKAKEEEQKTEKKTIIKTISDKFTDFFKTME